MGNNNSSSVKVDKSIINSANGELSRAESIINEDSNEKSKLNTPIRKSATPNQSVTKSKKSL